ncbi:acyclic terpene utilization AtuA family protein (plasmid) [Haloferax sp. S1W]|uniref:acyclic terpene utilization AtuA family protein n=1 Tax=Haloferax sp. S1W TaxID=3377110 RepID=UPI0037CA1072
MNELRFLALNGLMHGNGFPESSLEAGLEADPAFIGIDAGSTDGGPYYLGAGENMHQSRAAAKEVLRTLITHARAADIPLLVGSAATGGGRVHLDWTVELVREIATEEALEFTVGAIDAEQSASTITQAIDEGRLEALDGSKPLTRADVESSERIVAVMGPEPYTEALDRGADVVIAGRSSDVSIFKALPVEMGFDEGLATHLAKTIECGGQIATPSTGGDCMLGVLTDEYFRVTPTNPEKTTSPLSVASHMLYESADPFVFVEPRGTLHTDDCSYQAVDDRTVEVRGSRFEPAAEYTLKLEGARLVGYRAITVLGIRDPVLVHRQLDAFLDRTTAAVAKKAKTQGIQEYTISTHVYGRDAVMGAREPDPTPSHEVGVVVDVVAPTADTAKGLVHHAGNYLLHADYPNRTSTAGNVAFPLSPQDAAIDRAYEFSVWHRMSVEDPLERFDISTEVVG